MKNVYFCEMNSETKSVKMPLPLQRSFLTEMPLTSQLYWLIVIQLSIPARFHYGLASTFVSFLLFYNLSLVIDYIQLLETQVVDTEKQIECERQIKQQEMVWKHARLVEEWEDCKAKSKLPNKLLKISLVFIPFVGFLITKKRKW